ncbi:MAG: redoxin family protein [Thermodesulfobacteriota bacterium]
MTGRKRPGYGKGSAQKRFAEEAGLGDLQYLSDHASGAWARAVGLLSGDLGLLARAVVVVDRQGKVRYLQVVPEMTHLPDMEGAFQKARALSLEP